MVSFRGGQISFAPHPLRNDEFDATEFMVEHWPYTNYTNKTLFFLFHTSTMSSKSLSQIFCGDFHKPASHNFTNPVPSPPYMKSLKRNPATHAHGRRVHCNDSQWRPTDSAGIPIMVHLQHTWTPSMGCITAIHIMHHIKYGYHVCYHIRMGIMWMSPYKDMYHGLLPYKDGLHTCIIIAILFLTK